MKKSKEGRSRENSSTCGNVTKGTAKEAEES